VSRQAPLTIAGEAEFLAHIIALKHESEDRLTTMADCLFAHNNPPAAQVFHELAGLISLVVEQLQTLALDHVLPEIPPWEYQWHCEDDPEALCMEHAHYLMSARQALQLALYNEQRSVEFLQRIEREVSEPAVREMARRQLRVEQEFAEIIRQRLADLPDEDVVCDDLDPPHMPE
jgi:hypothetical protein